MTFYPRRRNFLQTNFLQHFWFVKKQSKAWLTEYRGPSIILFKSLPPVKFSIICWKWIKGFSKIWPLVCIDIYSGVFFITFMKNDTHLYKILQIKYIFLIFSSVKCHLQKSPQPRLSEGRKKEAYHKMVQRPPCYFRSIKGINDAGPLSPLTLYLLLLMAPRQSVLTNCKESVGAYYFVWSTKDKALNKVIDAL